MIRMMKSRKLMWMISTGFVIVFLEISTAFGQVGTEMMPKIVEKNGRHALLVDGQPFFMLGGQAHNSSGWPGVLPKVWSAVKAMNANTLEVPIYWEQIEPQPGKFDFSLVDSLLKQGREHKVHLVLLWFATWKNGSSHYMPEWMKHEPAKYPNITGRDGNPVDSPSPHTQAAMEFDAMAFKAVMGYLKKADPQHTVIMVQVENEPGAWGSVRDYSPVARKLFEGPVPDELLKPEVLKSLKKQVDAKGTWSEVFGNDADEYFHAWSVARYIGYVAAAGKAVNPLPLYVNAALRDPISNPSASTYESGGATDNVIPIWKVAAPAIDLLAPDIYLSGTDTVLKVIELYNRPDNTLFVPEIGSSAEYTKYMYEVLARGGIGFSPFGIDDNGQGEGETEIAIRLAPLSQEYAMAGPMMRELAKWGFEGKIKAVVEREDRADQTIDLGSWQAIVSFGASGRRTAQTNKRPIGKAMIIQLGNNEFVLIGTLCHFTFKPLGANSGKAWQYLKVEEGQYENGTFKLLRIRNGDETDWGGPSIGAIPAVLHTTLTLR
jgi:beta-galactosidase GanA